MTKWVITTVELVKRVNNEKREKVKDDDIRRTDGGPSK
jgi:hypothetical protein